MKDLLLGIDVGTTGTKAAVFTFNGELLYTSQSGYSIRHEHPGWAEQNPEDWWNAVVKAVRKTVVSVRGFQERIAGIAVSSLAPTMVPLDRSGRVVRPALIWMDRRSTLKGMKQYFKIVRPDPCGPLRILHKNIAPFTNQATGDRHLVP